MGRVVVRGRIEEVGVGELRKRRVVVVGRTRRRRGRRVGRDIVFCGFGTEKPQLVLTCGYVVVVIGNYRYLPK